MFEELHQLLDHKDSEEIITFEKVFDKIEGNKINLSKKGRWEIIKLIENYKDNYLNNKDLKTDNIFSKVQSDPRLNTPRDTITRIKDI